MQNVQVNQNVNAANFMLVSSQTGYSKPVQEESANPIDFADVLKSTSNRQQSNTTIDFSDRKDDSNIGSKDDYPERDIKTPDSGSVDMEKSVDAEKTEESADVSDSDNEKANPETKVDTDDSGADVGDSETVESMEQSQVTKLMDGLEEISEEELATLFETIGNLFADIMQQFNLSLDELSVKLEEFGMEFSDLMTKDGLKEFFLQMKGIEASDLLVDDDMNQEWQAFLTDVSDELVTMETMISDMDAFVSNEEIERMLTELTVSSEELEDMEMIPSKAEEDVFASEPEVIVESKETYAAKNIENNDNLANSGDSQSNEPSDSPQKNISYESTVDEQKEVKQNTFANPILQAIQDAVNNAEVAIVSEQPVQQTDILRQVVEQVRVNMNQQQTSLELQLYPEHLGRIQINVVAKEGVMTASIVAETEAAKQAIEAGILNLKEAMEQQDLKVESIEVMVSTTGFANNDDQQKSFDEKGSSNPRRKLSVTDLVEDVSVEDEAEVEKMKASGSSVSYRA